jgi:hypothetical protein
VGGVKHRAHRVHGEGESRREREKPRGSSRGREKPRGSSRGREKPRGSSRGREAGRGRGIAIEIEIGI